MRRGSSALRFFTLAATAAIGLAVILSFPARAGNPHGAFYSPANDRIFWFVRFSDPHIGVSGSQDSTNLTWLVTTGRTFIDPSFMVATGDLTDSTNGNIFGYPNGPHQAEWDQYKSILDPSVDANFYYDLPGNHDAYSDRDFAYYKANSVQGRATGGSTQISWTREFPFGKYHFLGINSADNTGNGFSLLSPYGDHAGLDAAELAYIDGRLDDPGNADADLTMVFGHHPVTDTGASGDTWLYYGHREFIGALDSHAASVYGYGHTHEQSDVMFTGNAYTGTMTGGGIRYLNIASSGKSSSSNYDIVAVDCNGVSSVPATIGQWPVVLITAPVSRVLGGQPNPYSYSVPAASDNRIRALVFSEAAVTSVRYRIGYELSWRDMSPVAGNPRLYEGIWDASALPAGDYIMTVEATSGTTKSHAITVTVDAAVAPNEPPVAINDAFTMDQGTVLTVPASGVLANDSDPDGDPLTAGLLTSPAHGSVSLDPNGSFTYTPSTGFAGSDVFTYAAHDGEAASVPATVSIAVLTSGPDTIDILTASYATKSKRLRVEATSSVQPGATLTVVGYGDMTWDPAGSKYVLDKRIASAPGDHVTVTSSRGGIDDFYFGDASNLRPIANSQVVTVLMNTAKPIILTATDPNGDPLTYTTLSGPAHGALSGTAPNMTYTPVTGYMGGDGFTFKASDGRLDSDVASITITVSGSKDEEVVVLMAEYRTKTRQLTVQATSSLQPGVTMEVAGYGVMTFDAALNRYVFSRKVTAVPGATVTVQSSGGGAGSRPVTVK